MTFLLRILLGVLIFCSACKAQNLNLYEDECINIMPEWISNKDSIISFSFASYQGGEKNLTIFMENGLKNYRDTSGNIINKKYYATIFISEKGEVEKIEFRKEPNPCNSCFNAAEKMIYSMKWIPAYGIFKDGSKRNLKDRVILPFKF